MSILYGPGCLKSSIIESSRPPRAERCDIGSGTINAQTRVELASDRHVVFSENLDADSACSETPEGLEPGLSAGLLVSFVGISTIHEDICINEGQLVHVARRGRDSAPFSLRTGAGQTKIGSWPCHSLILRASSFQGVVQRIGRRLCCALQPTRGPSGQPFRRA